MEADIGARVRERMREVLPGVKQQEIAERIQLTPDAFSRSLNGKRAFTAIELVELAELLKTSAHWFVTGEPDPFAVKVAGRQTFDHDALAHQSIDWIGEGHILNVIARLYIQVFAEDVPATPPRVRRLDASAIRSAFVGSSSGENWVRRFADTVEEVYGIDVIRVSDAPRDCAIEVLGHSVIVLKETGNWFYENWSIAHELAHILAGDLSTVVGDACGDSSAERRANAFAAELLLPESRLRSLAWPTVSSSEIARILWETGVSTRVLLNRLSTLRIDAPSTLRAKLDQPTQRFIRAELPDLTGEIADRIAAAARRRFPERLVAAHYEAVAAGWLPAAMLEWMLGVENGQLGDELSPELPEPDIERLGRDLGLLD
jgi:Zn-dependent peptidase ImmA (M78 family)